MDGMLQKLGLEDGEAIVHPWINKALEKAQEKVEARNFDIRKQLLKYDDVMNDQRKVIYEQRKDLMRATDVQEDVTEMRRDVIEDVVSLCIPENAYAEQWDTENLHVECLRIFGLDLPIEDWAKEEGIADQEIQERISDAVNRRLAEKAANYGPDLMRMAEKSLLLQIVDQSWKEHLLHLDHLRQGIGLRAYGQRDPLNEYKREAFNLFEAMLGTLRQTVTGVLANIEVQAQATPEELEARMAADRLSQEMHEGRTDPALAMSDEEREALAASGGYDGRGHRPLLSNRAAASRRPGQSRHLGQGRPQFSLSLRFRQKIQTLPRSPGLEPFRNVDHVLFEFQDHGRGPADRGHRPNGRHRDLLACLDERELDRHPLGHPAPPPVRVFALGSRRRRATPARIRWGSPNRSSPPGGSEPSRPCASPPANSIRNVAPSRPPSHVDLLTGDYGRARGVYSRVRENLAFDRA